MDFVNNHAQNYPSLCAKIAVQHEIFDVNIADDIGGYRCYHNDQVDLYTQLVFAL